MKEKMISDLCKELETYHIHYLYLCDLLEVYNQLDKMDCEKYNMAPTFFKITKCTYVDTFMICLARLYDSDKDAMSIPNFLNKCKKNSSLFQNKLLFENKIDSFINELTENEEYSSAIQMIKMRRDKMFAHNDKKYFVNPQKDDSYLPMYKLWYLRDYTIKVLGFVASQLNYTFERKVLYSGDLKNLLK